MNIDSIKTDSQQYFEGNQDLSYQQYSQPEQQERQYNPQKPMNLLQNPFFAQAQQMQPRKKNSNLSTLMDDARIGGGNIANQSFATEKSLNPNVV